MSERLVIPDRVDAESELSVAVLVGVLCTLQRCRVPERSVVRMHERESEGVMMRWGLVPPSAESEVERRVCARVRGDAIVRSEDFRAAWFNGQRGIVPLAGYYVWQRAPADTASRTTCGWSTVSCLELRYFGIVR